MQREAAALRRSFDVYYRDAARTARMDALNAQFVGKGALAFDIGAHVGDRTASLSRLGAQVVAVEPQPRMFRALQLIHGRRPGIFLHRSAVGAAEGDLTLHVNSHNPTVSTASPDMIDAAQDAERWQGQVWDRRITVPVTTLDRLIAKHGLPDFVKIDVEGYEPDVLAGLSVPIPALSFEFTTIQRGLVEACLSRLVTLGAYEFNVSLGEDHALRHRDWITAQDISAQIAALPDAANSGDIYARRLTR